MAHKTKVNGTAYEVSGGKTKVNGTGYSISGGKTKVNGTAYGISFITGTPISTLAVGSTVKIKVKGSLKDFIIVHQGKPSSIYDNSCNGTWLLMKDIYTTMERNGNGVYANTTEFSYLNSTFLGLLDSGVQSVIKTVKIPYREGNGKSGSTKTGSEGLSAKIFDLSAVELGVSRSTMHVDGSCLSYFNNATNSKRIANYNGTATPWWTRTAYNALINRPWAVSTDGSLYGSDGSGNYHGVRPAFVIPSETLVDNNSNLLT